jgi:hypothetical protein
MFKDDASVANQVLPFTSWDSPRPEQLWEFLADYEAKAGGQAFAIPHNSNLTYGRMFSVRDSNGEPLTRSHALTRSRWEPVVEATQIKGDSETHPVISPEDKFAEFETWNGWAGKVNGGKMWTGNNVRIRPDELIKYEYVRSALQLGLQQLAATGANPFKFGLIGSTDSHTALTGVAEDNFWGKTRAAEPSARRATQAYSVLNWEMSAAGYDAVWARENTREAIFDAMRRREVYATTGPRITLRFFAGWAFEDDDALRPDLARSGYAKGVPMGSDLGPGPAGSSPGFLIQAAKDPIGANLDRVQVVKGWLDDAGVIRENVYNVAVSGDRKIRRNGTVKNVGSTVNVAEASYTNAIGNPELSVMWHDPDFSPDQHAVYYVRVLEIPTPRWTAYDAKFYGLDLPDEVTMVTQERAYSSPIWYTPDNNR